MKARNREINIFSMSALDLFASAMGAFMLLALVYLVFFTMTSRSAVDVPEPQTPAVPEPVAVVECPDVPEPAACPEVPDTQPLEDALAMCRQTASQQAADAASCAAARSELAEQVEALKFPHVDLVVALDVTASMAGPLAGLKSEIDQLVDVLNRLAPSVAMGIVAFGDRRWRRPVFHQDLLEVKHSPANRDMLKRQIAGLRVNMGIGLGSNPDDAEAVLAALQVAVSSTWRPEADRQIVVVVTDNPAYASERLQALEVARQFVDAKAGRAVSTVFVNTRVRRALRADAGADFLRNLATAGKGQFVQDGGSMTANLLLALL